MAHASDDDLEDLYEDAPCGYLSMSPDGVIARVNRTLLTWLGATRDDVVGKRFQELLSVPSKIFHDTHYMPLLAMQGAAREIAFDLKRPHGDPLPAIVTTIGRRDAAGSVTCYRTVVLDSSSRRSYERELVRLRQSAEQAATHRSALLAMLSHDIRSPLASIVMALDMLDQAGTPAARARLTDVMRRATNSALDLVNAMLDHSKLEAGGARWEPEPTDLRALLAEIAAVHAVKAEAKGIELRAQIDPALPAALLVDRFKLVQIVTNLVSNAIKFTDKGHVHIELRANHVDSSAADIELRVSDTGIGIAPEQLGSIFDEFRQATAGTARRYGGVGLGLAISRKLAALAGTTIDVTSTVGVGTTFSSRLHVPIG